MYVCHCAAVTDSTIRDAIREGATDPMAVGVRCQAGVNCGGCLPRVCALLAEAGHPVDGAAGAVQGVCLPARRSARRAPSAATA